MPPRPGSVVRRAACAAFSALALASLPATAQEKPPALPSLALQQFPEAARAAVSVAYQAAARQPSDPRAVGSLARLLQAWEQWDTAHQVYARAQALAPGTFEWQYLDAVVLQRMARHAEAAERLRVATKISPEFKPARVKLADALFEAGQVDESRRLFEALATDPATGLIGEFGLGRIAALEKRHEEAVERLQKAVTQFPEWGSAYYALALSYRALGRREDAARALALHAKYGPAWPALDDPVLATVSALRDDGRALLQRGIALAARGDLPGAIEAHEAALAKDPNQPQAHANLISLYGRTKQWDKAETHYREALRLGGDAADAHYDYGVLLGMQEKWDEAAAAYRKAIAANPVHAGAYNNLGDVFERQRKLEAALECYRKAYESRPVFRLARLNVGRMLMALGKDAEAVTELEPIVEPRDAEAPRYMFALAVAYVRTGRKEDGIKWATDARRLALEHGQTELAAVIERDLGRLK
jgi:tetratricopeptide (TPR) repeat protein